LGEDTGGLEWEISEEGAWWLRGYAMFMYKVECGDDGWKWKRWRDWRGWLREWLRDGGEIGSDLEREEHESARVEQLVDRVGWKKQASRDVPVQPSSDIDTYI
jgi:hypothetical protein